MTNIKNQSLYDVSKFKEVFPNSFIEVTGIRILEITVFGKKTGKSIKKKIQGIGLLQSSIYFPENNNTKIKVFSLIKILITD